MLGNALLATPGSDPTNPVSLDDAQGPLEVQTLEPNRVLLLNKIDRLQRTNVRLMEKIDFMNEHIAQLTQELQKKSQVLQVGLVFLVYCFLLIPDSGIIFLLGTTQSQNSSIYIIFLITNLDKPNNARCAKLQCPNRYLIFFS